MAKLVSISTAKVTHIPNSEAPEIAHLFPVDEQEAKNKIKGKNCWKRFVTSITSAFGASNISDELQPISLRTQKTINDVKEMLRQEEKQSGNTKELLSKCQKLHYPLTSISEMVEQMKEMILELTFSRHCSISMDYRLLELVKGKTVVGLYAWMCSYCFFHMDTSDKEFWDRFAYIVSHTIRMWNDMLTIMTNIEHLRQTGTHIVRLLDKHVLEVSLENEGKKYRRRKEEVKKMKEFDKFKSKRAWGSNLAQPRQLRTLYLPNTDQSLKTFYPKWLGFEMLDTKVQIKYLYGILDYVDRIIISVLPILSAITEKTIYLDKSMRFIPTSETDNILGMIILDSLDQLTLTAKTLQMYIKEMRTIVYTCYEFSRYQHPHRDTKTYEKLYEHTLHDTKHTDNSLSPLNIHEASLKFNTETYADILQKLPLYTVEFTMILQDQKNVFDFDALSVTAEKDM